VICLYMVIAGALLFCFILEFRALVLLEFLSGFGQVS